MPAASLTIPTVPRLTKGKHRLKKARGFSLAELSQAGLQVLQARSLGVRVDERRSTAHVQNVSILKALLDKPASKTGPSQPSIGTVVEGAEASTDLEQAEKKPRRPKSSPT